MNGRHEEGPNYRVREYFLALEYLLHLLGLLNLSLNGRRTLYIEGMDHVANVITTLEVSRSTVFGNFAGCRRTINSTILRARRFYILSRRVVIYR